MAKVWLKMQKVSKWVKSDKNIAKIPWQSDENGLEVATVVIKVAQMSKIGWKRC